MVDRWDDTYVRASNKNKALLPLLESNVSDDDDHNARRGPHEKLAPLSLLFARPSFLPRNARSNKVYLPPGDGLCSSRVWSRIVPIQDVLLNCIKKEMAIKCKDCANNRFKHAPANVMLSEWISLTSIFAKTKDPHRSINQPYVMSTRRFPPSI